MKIGIFGSSSGDDSKKEDLKQKAREIGKTIAKNKGIVVTGACNGLPQEAVLGALELNGKRIGFSPCSSFEEHKKQNLPIQFSDIVFIPENYAHIKNIQICRKYRNVSSVAYCDAAIFISGRIGTMNEFTNAYDMGKVIGVLEESGGISDRTIKILLEDANKNSEAKVIFEKDPEKLVRKVMNLE